MGILLHPTPPALPIATTYDLRWFAPLQGTLVLDALRWFAQHMDENGVVRTPTPARPSPLAMAFFHHGPLTFVLLPATRDPKGPVPLVIAAREPDGALRPFLWPFSCQSHVQRGVVDVLTQAFSMETAAHFATVLRAMARPARHADEASDRCPVLPWLLDGLASRTDGPQHLVLNKTLEGVLRTAWEWAGAVPNSASAPVSKPATFRAKGLGLGRHALIRPRSLSTPDGLARRATPWA